MSHYFPILRHEIVQKINRILDVVLRVISRHFQEFFFQKLTQNHSFGI